MNIETKFSIGQKILYIEHGYILSGIVSKISIEAKLLMKESITISKYYTVNDRTLSEIECFASKEELLKSIEKRLKYVKLQETL